MTAADEALPFTLDVPVPADAEDIARVHTDAWRAAYTGLMPDAFWDADALDGRATGWRRMLTEDPARLREQLRIVRDGDGIAQGFCRVGPARDMDPPREVQLWALNLAPALFGSGAGRALVEDLLGDRPAYLWVAEANARARRFYEKLGFAADGGVLVDEALGGLREIRMTR